MDRKKWASALCAAAAIAAVGPASGASAAVSAPHNVTALYNTSGLELSGYPAGAQLTAQVVRNGVTIGTASGAADAAGILDVNPTACWETWTPEILPGDTVRVSGAGIADTTVVQNVTAGAPVQSGADIVVHGTASDAAGNPLPLAEIENRLQAKSAYAFNGRKVLRAIGAGGGDGTISTVAARLVGTDKALGVLPLGTLNHFAKDLRIPLGLEEAARNVCEGREVSVDVGEVNGQVFVNNSSLGLYPRIVRRREKLQEREGSGKWAAFMRASLAVLRRYPFLYVRLDADGQRIVRKTPFVFVGNNEYEMESLQMGGRACLDAGCLSLYVAHRTGRLGLLRLALSALFGRLRRAHDFDALNAQEIWVETRRPKRLPVATDGEVNVMTTPLRYRVRPGALKVIVPKEVMRDK